MRADPWLGTDSSEPRPKRSQEKLAKGSFCRQSFQRTRRRTQRSKDSTEVLLAALDRHFEQQNHDLTNRTEAQPTICIAPLKHGPTRSCLWPHSHTLSYHASSWTLSVPCPQRSSCSNVQSRPAQASATFPMGCSDGADVLTVRYVAKLNQAT